MMKEMISKFFSFEGRRNRVDYLIVILGTWFMNIVLELILKSREDILSLVIGLVLLVAIGVKVIFSMIQRFHDLGQPGKKVWFMLIPIYNIYLAFVLIFKKGDSESNQYGNVKKI